LRACHRPSAVEGRQSVPAQRTLHLRSSPCVPQIRPYQAKRTSEELRFYLCSALKAVPHARGVVWIIASERPAPTGCIGREPANATTRISPSGARVGMTAPRRRHAVASVTSSPPRRITRPATVIRHPGVRVSPHPSLSLGRITCRSCHGRSRHGHSHDRIHLGQLGRRSRQSKSGVTILLRRRDGQRRGRKPTVRRSNVAGSATRSA